jgi:hypothetical protein
MKRDSLLYKLACFHLAWVAGACGKPEEASRVELPVVTDPSGVEPVTTNLGYFVELTEARAAVENFEFSVAGDVHTASLGRKLLGLVIPNAHAHPGHFQGGDITGELRGRFLLSWRPPTTGPLGTAILITGTYTNANFTFRRAGTEDGLALDDALVGHTALLRGRATRSGASVLFVARLDSPEGRKLLGAPFPLAVTPSSRERLGLRFTPKDPVEEITLFDGIDFAALDTDGDGQVALDETTKEAKVLDAYNQLRRAFQTHDYFSITPLLPQ